MARPRLDNAGVIASFTLVGGKRMPKSMGTHSLGDPCLPYDLFHNPL